jgi:hypothetical protein
MLSPDVLASHQATLELHARDEDRRAPPSEALTALEEELVQRHQRELAIAAERDRLRRELAGVGRERLDELRKAQSDDLARLDRETAARAAERAALAEEVAALERAAHVDEDNPVTARSARSVKRTLSETRDSLRVRTAPDPRPSSGEALQTLIGELASPAGIAAQERRIAELRAESQPRPPPSRASEDWSPAELLDAWLEGDPRGLLQGAGRPRTPSVAPTPRVPTPKAPTPRQPTPKAPTPRQPTPSMPQQQQQPPPYGFQQTFPGMPPYGFPPPSFYAPPPPQPAQQQDSSLLQFQMMQLQQQQQQQRFDDQLRRFKEETARQSREAVETLRRENAQLLTEVQRLKERHVTPKSSRRPKTPVVACVEIKFRAPDAIDAMLYS